MKRSLMNTAAHVCPAVSSSSLSSLFAASASGFRLLSKEELQASRLAAMQHWQSGSDVWIFGYGSLIWRPEFAFEEKRPALLRGWHRSLCLWSRVNRGTPERPGLVLGLDAGGACRGVVYRIAGASVPQTLDALWQREMPAAAYLPKWLSCQTQQGKVQALVFVMDRRKPSYARGLSAAQQAQIVCSARGKYGDCAEYVMKTVQALRVAHIRDARLEAVAQILPQYT